MGFEILNKQVIAATIKQLKIVWQEFLQLNPDLLTMLVKKPIIKHSNCKDKKAFTAIIKLFLKLDPIIFVN